MQTYRVEFHCHTCYSGDSLTRPASLVQACRRKGITRVVVTDHNTIEGARRAQELDPELVIIGEEIMTRSGEILAAFVTEEIPAGLSAEETIERLRAQGAFISVSHPFDLLRKGHWKLAELQKITPWVDAIETFNARCVSNLYNQQAQAYALEHQLAGTAGSDAHTTFELGQATLLLPHFDGAESLRTALRSAQPQLKLSSPLIHLSSRWAVWRKKMFPQTVTCP